MKNFPLVSVVMPVYNAGEYLSIAIDSILNQTFTDFEFIIIDDCSTDDSLTTIEKYANEDKRIKTLRNNPNCGISNTLNRGLKEACGKYIAIMHSDDIADCNRFDMQVGFLEKHTDISILGTNFEALGIDWVTNFATSPEAVKFEFFNENIIGHPTVMFNRERIIDNNLFYKKEYDGAEDFKMWTDAVVSGLKVSNLPDILLKYRIHQNQTSSVKSQQINEMALNIRCDYIRSFFGIHISDENLELFFVTDKPVALNKWYSFKKAVEDRNLNNPNLTQKEINTFFEKKMNWMLKKNHFKEAMKLQTTNGERFKLRRLYIKRALAKIFRNN